MSVKEVRTSPEISKTLHATAVALNGKAVLILGRSGSGKSGFALQLMACGALLVADDRVHITKQDQFLQAHAPDTLPGHVEARGVGILKADYVQSAEIVLVVDLETAEKDRLPVPRSCSILGVNLPVVRRVDAPYFPAAILQFLKSGRAEL
ncbi:HPr kinase/phosphorylase [Halocynthiibacter styelae]|uniref:HPr kinase/phosphatase C-terminal domain-containing protein n=1 Tax=Halocynthiibacter styelae TaxID=2761955 RepID=A0A8J7LP15_9RHOB|nr:HPr kinase/phosphatase C-terminal domain-containing protein [Paenihalocynthiibacter styelae]MBI1492926.1 HPr kinase/phosphatase C-terminal domain-containing protein [Paenihalocynthiibacter styelae]